MHKANFIKDVGKGFMGHIISNDSNAEWNTQYNMPNFQEKIFTCYDIIRIYQVNIIINNIFAR